MDGDDFTMVSVDITDSLIGISHESSEIKESEYRVRDDTSLLDLIVYTGAVKMSCVEWCGYFCVWKKLSPTSMNV